MIELKINHPIILHEVDDFSFMIEYSESKIVNYFYSNTKINGKIYANFLELQKDFN